MVAITVATQVTIRTGMQGVKGTPGTAALHAPTHSADGTDPVTVEDLATAGLVGAVPTSDGAGGLTMSVPAGGGNVVSTGGEAAGFLSEFTGPNAIGTTTITTASVSGHLASTSNPHSVTAAQAGAEPAGSIATHAADADAHHAELHTLASHSDTTTTGPALDAHIASTSNPHAVTAAQVGADPTGTSSAAVSAHNTDTGAHANLPVENLATSGTSGQVPTSDGAGGLTMQTPSTGTSDHTALSNLTPGDAGHTDLQLRSEKNAVSGYAGLDGSSKLAGTQQAYGTTANTACEGNDARLSDARTPTGAAGGDLAGTYGSPSVAAVTTTTGPTSLTIGAVADGEFLVRTGSTLVGGMPAGSGNVDSPGGETAGRITKFTGANAIDETATTEAELSTAVTHSGVVTGNPHAVTAAQVGAEASGSIATHAALADAHHDEVHTLASHSDVATTGAALDAHIADVTGNPHAVTAAQAGAEPSGSIATHAALPDAHHDEVHTLASHSDVATTGAQLDAHLASSSNPHSVTAAQVGADATGTAAAAVSAHDSDASAHSNLPVEALATAGTSGQVPTSDGAGGLTMETPASGGGNVTSPGGETAGRITKFTGANDIDETATTETELATAVTHSGIVTGNPHSVTAAQVGAEASGSIATHAALADAHHDEVHTLASHSDVATTGAQLDAHLASTSNPHSTSLSNLNGGSLADLNAAVTNATFETVSHYYRPCDLVSTLDADWAVNGNAPLSADTLDPSILVRRSDDTTEEGFGVQLPPIPVGATNMQIALEIRPQSGPGGSVVAKTLFYERDESTTVGSWSSSIALDDINFPVTSVDYINVVTDKTLATWGFVAGSRYRVQITRTATGDTLSGDLVFKGVKVSFT